MASRGDDVADPKTREEYTRLFQMNSQVIGEGVDVTQHIPCPFCATPDFYVVPILAAKTVLAEDSTCVECGRSGRHEIVAEGQKMAAEFVQTGGRDPAEGLKPGPRRGPAKRQSMKP